MLVATKKDKCLCVKVFGSSEICIRKSEHLTIRRLGVRLMLVCMFEFQRKAAVVPNRPYVKSHFQATHLYQSICL